MAGAALAELEVWLAPAAPHFALVTMALLAAVILAWHYSQVLDLPVALQVAVDLVVEGVDLTAAGEAHEGQH